jgi:hypothetical protein
VWASGILIVMFVLWLAAQCRQRIFRKRAEALLSDIKALELNHSTWSDSQRLMTRWGKWGHVYDTCDAEDCYYSINIGDELIDAPQFVFEEGPHIGARILDRVGLRSAQVTAGFHVIHGLVINKDFRVSVALPARNWTTPDGTYWPELAAGFRERSKLDHPNPHFRSSHPNRELILRRIILEAVFTPEESPEEQSALTGFRFDCITRWSPCLKWAELYPGADEEFEAERQEWRREVKASGGEGFFAPTCFPTLEIRAREAPVVLVGQVVRVVDAPDPRSTDPRPQTGWMIDVLLKQVLKGKAPVPIGSAISFHSPRDSTPKPVGQMVLIMGETDRNWSTNTLVFRLSDCGLDAASNENLAEALKGVRDDFGPLY